MAAHPRKINQVNKPKIANPSNPLNKEEKIRAP